MRIYLIFFGRKKAKSEIQNVFQSFYNKVYPECVHSIKYIKDSKPFSMSLRFDPACFISHIRSRIIKSIKEKLSISFLSISPFKTILAFFDNFNQNILNSGQQLQGRRFHSCVKQRPLVANS